MIVRDGRETWLRVNPPVMFARNRTTGVDEQMVGHRLIAIGWATAGTAHGLSGLRWPANPVRHPRVRRDP